jgi:carbon-monoxide dehydrogenase large subunit
MTYPIVRASQLPNFETDRTVTPTPHSPLGAKGAGDVPVNGVPPAIVSAVCNAVGVRHINMPLTPEKLWRAMQSG